MTQHDDPTERRLADGLAAGAAGAPEAVGLADAARGRARRRRRSRVAALGAAAALVVALPVGVVMLNDGGSGPDGSRVTDPSGADQAALDAPATRTESWRGVTVEVPAGWGYGSTSAYCANGGGPEPVVSRPGGLTPAIGCNPARGYGLTFGDTATIDLVAPSGTVAQEKSRGLRSAYPDGTWVGYWYDADDLVQVASPDRATAEAVIASVRAVDDVEPNGCPTREEGGVAETAEGEVAVCRYDAEGDLAQSELLTGDDAATAAGAVGDAPPGAAARDCLNAATEHVVMSADGERVDVQYAGVDCADRGVIQGENVSELTEDVLYWALSPGWRGDIGAWAPVPDPLRELVVPEGATDTLPGTDVEPAGGPLVGCGDGASWPVSVMDGGLAGELDEAQVRAAFAALVEEAGPDAPSAIQEQGADAVEYTVLDAGDEPVVGVGPWSTLSGPGERAQVVSLERVGGELDVAGWGDCQLAVATEGRSQVEVTAPSGGVDGSTTTPTVMVTEVQCASGRDPDGFLSAPQVVETTETVTVLVTSEPAGEADCQGNPSVPLVLELDEPIGDRQLLDGGVWPARPVEVGSGAEVECPDGSYANSDFALGADPGGALVVCRMEFSDQAESGGSYLLTETTVLTEEESDQLRLAIAEAPPLQREFVRCDDPRGRVFNLVLSADGEAVPFWVYEGRCGQQGLLAGTASGDADQRETTPRVVRALRPAHTYR